MNKKEQPKTGLFTINVEKLSFSEDINVLDVFSPFANSPWSMWLDSCDTKHIDSQFDILVFDPLITLSTFAENTHITSLNKAVLSIVDVGNVGETKVTQEDPLSLIRRLNISVFGDNIEKHKSLPFIGGALGYFAYDLGRRFEKLPTKAEQDIALADMSVGIYHQAIIFDNKSRCYWLVCPKEQREELEQSLRSRIESTKVLAESLTEVSNKARINVLNNEFTKPLTAQNTKTATTQQTPFSLTSAWQSNMDRASYGEKFETVQNYLLSGDCYQINLAQRFKAQYQGCEFNAYKSLRKENKAPFSAFIQLENSAILSLSPERFLQESEGHVQSKPIKGTLPRSADAKQDNANADLLKLSTKDRAENLMIVDLLRNDMSKVCIAGSVKVPKLFDIESFPAVHHLVSTVEGKLSPDKHATDLLRGAFPGGSITGAPKIRAMQIIEELEPHRRSIYCGSIGYVSRCNTMDTSITIRTLVCQKEVNSIYCWAGGGLVADSNVDSEYQETFDKVQRILPVLSNINLSSNR